MGIYRQEYWSGLPLPSPGDLPNPGIEPGSPALQTNTVLSETPGKPTVNSVSKSLTDGSDLAYTHDAQKKYLEDIKHSCIIFILINSM